MSEMTSRERLETAWRFQEPDRVPIELNIAPSATEDPRAADLVALIDKYTDKFGGWSPPWGYFCMESTCSRSTSCPRTDGSMA